MKTKREKIFTKELLKVLHGSSRNERVLHRLHSVALVLHGFSASAAGRLYKDSPRAVAYWVKRFKENGLDGLEEEARPGRPAKLTPRQIRVVQLLLTDCRRTGKLATAKMISDYILHEFGVTLTIRQCERIIKRLSV
jgi:transposase